MLLHCIHVFYRGHLINYANEATVWNQQELINSFGVGNKLGSDMMFYLSHCLLSNDIEHKKSSVGYRVIIPTNAIVHNLQTLLFVFLVQRRSFNLFAFFFVNVI